MTSDVAKEIRKLEDTLLWKPGNLPSGTVIETRFIKGRTVRVERKKRRGK